MIGDRWQSLLIDPYDRRQQLLLINCLECRDRRYYYWLPLTVGDRCQSINGGVTIDNRRWANTQTIGWTPLIVDR